MTFSTEEVMKNIRTDMPILLGNSISLQELREEVMPSIIGIIVFGSVAKTVHGTKGFIFKEDLYETCHDLDIAVIFKDHMWKKLAVRKPKTGRINEDLCLYMGMYEPDVVAKKAIKRDYLFLELSELERDIKEKKPHALSIKNGIIIYLHSPEMRKVLNKEVQE